jgi:hypothetical protein
MPQHTDLRQRIPTSTTAVAGGPAALKDRRRYAPAGRGGQTPDRQGASMPHRQPPTTTLGPPALANHPRPEGLRAALSAEWAEAGDTTLHTRSR